MQIQLLLSFLFACQNVAFGGIPRSSVTSWIEKPKKCIFLRSGSRWDPDLQQLLSRRSRRQNFWVCSCHRHLQHWGLHRQREEGAGLDHRGGKVHGPDLQQTSVSLVQSCQRKLRKVNFGHSTLLFNIVFLVIQVSLPKLNLICSTWWGVLGTGRTTTRPSPWSLRDQRAPGSTQRRWPMRPGSSSLSNIQRRKPSLRVWSLWLWVKTCSVQ